MGSPIPKPGDQSIRRTVSAANAKPTRRGVATRSRPPAASRDWPPYAKDFYKAAVKSGQSAFYEPSDWQMLRVCTQLLIAATERGTATLYAEFTKLAASLMLTENERRRNYVELAVDEPTDGKSKTSDGVRAALSVVPE